MILFHKYSSLQNLASGQPNSSPLTLCNHLRLKNVFNSLFCGSLSSECCKCLGHGSPTWPLLHQFKKKKAMVFSKRKWISCFQTSLKLATPFNGGAKERLLDKCDRIKAASWKGINLFRDAKMSYIYKLGRETVWKLCWLKGCCNKSLNETLILPPQGLKLRGISERGEKQCIQNRVRLKSSIGSNCL